MRTLFPTHKGRLFPFRFQWNKQYPLYQTQDNRNIIFLQRSIMIIAKIFFLIQFLVVHNHTLISYKVPSNNKALLLMGVFQHYRVSTFSQAVMGPLFVIYTLLRRYKFSGILIKNSKLSVKQFHKQISQTQLEFCVCSYYECVFTCSISR